MSVTGKLPAVPLTVILIAATLSCRVVGGADGSDDSVKSQIKSLDNGDIVVIQEVTIDAPVKKVWDAYTTSVGWRSWVAPVATVELKTGGAIKTNYRPGGAVTDDDANTLRVVNYVPQRILTLQAELSDNWPTVLKKHQKQMFNVITFEPQAEQKTKLVSYGTGYRDIPELKKLLEFFVPANEKLYRQLIAYVEQGTKAF